MAAVRGDAVLTAFTYARQSRRRMSCPIRLTDIIKVGSDLIRIYFSVRAVSSSCNMSHSPRVSVRSDTYR